MAISATYIVLQQQIADEIGGNTALLSPLSGSSLTLSPVKNAIQSAIARWEREPFYFNEDYDTSFFSTANGTEVYTSVTSTKISTLLNIYRLHVTVAGSRYALVRRTWAYMDDSAVSTTTGAPMDFAYFAQQIRLNPIPDAIYVVAASYMKRLSALSADSDTNGWTTDGFDLIRSEAKRILAREVLHDEEMAHRMALAIHGDPQVQGDRGYLGILRDETARRGRFDTLRAEHDDGPGSMAAARNRQAT